MEVVLVPYLALASSLFEQADISCKLGPGEELCTKEYQGVMLLVVNLCTFAVNVGHGSAGSNTPLGSSSLSRALKLCSNSAKLISRASNRVRLEFNNIIIK